MSWTNATSLNADPLYLAVAATLSGQPRRHVEDPGVPRGDAAATRFTR